MRVLSALIIVAVVSFLLPVDGAAVEILYGGVGRGSSASTRGTVVILDQTTAAGTLVGHPAGVTGLTGLAFDSTGALFGTAIGSSFGPTNLIRIDPDTGALIGSALPITFLGAAITINDLAIQPGTGALFGTSADNTAPQSQLFTINKTTGVATLVGTVPMSFAGGGIAFASDGTLFQAFQGVLPDETTAVVGIQTLDPANAAVLSQALTGDFFFGGLAVRPSDGMLFGSTGRSNQIFAIEALTISPLTLSLTLIGTETLGSTGDLAFRVVPAPATLALLMLGLVALRWAPRRQMRRRDA